MSATTDRLYGRRGGRWAHAETGHLVEAVRAAKNPRRRAVDLARRAHPEELARARAHGRDCRHRPDEPCTARPDERDLDELWAGRARMATARAAAGVDLDRIDREALYRQGATDHV